MCKTVLFFFTQLTMVSIISSLCALLDFFLAPIIDVVFCSVLQKWEHSPHIIL